MFTTRPEIAGTFGVAASTHWLASQTAMAVLERGGNAFDAAVAGAFVLHVAEPHLNGPGGDAPIILHDAGTGKQHVICGQGPSPQAATLGAFAALGLDLIPGTGLLPAVVPGAFDAWALLLRDWGTWELADVLAYAIGYARNGCHVVSRISAQIETMRPMFEREWKTSAAVFLPGGKVPLPGSLLRRPALADTYERVCREAVGTSREARIDAARDAWYRGFVAEAVDRFFRGNEILDVSGRRHRGLLTGDDMARWSATVEAPLTYDYGEHTVLKCGPWSQGPVLLQMLALLKGFDIGAMDPVGADFVHVVAEAMKLAYADREAYYGDPLFATVPMEVLLSDAYNADRRALIGRSASMDLRPGTVPGFTPRGRSQCRRPRCAAVRRCGRQRGADGGPSWGVVRRYLSHRRHRPAWQHGQRHAIRRLAAIVAGDPGAWVSPGQPRPDVLVAPRPAEQPGARETASDHLVAQHGVAERQGLDGIRDAGR